MDYNYHIEEYDNGPISSYLVTRWKIKEPNEYERDKNFKESKTKVFYLQDMEPAALTRLDFINEMEQDLSFDDFGHVEVIGKYNTKCECLIVEQILPIREFLVLEPSKD